MLSTDFFFNNQRSEDMGIYLVKLSTDYSTTPFLPSRDIIEQDVPGNDRPYFFGVKRKPLQLKLTLSCLEGQWTIDKRRQLARWLNTETYELFYAADEPTKWYYCQYVDGIDLKYQHHLQGYIELTMRCDGAYTYSPVYDRGYVVHNAGFSVGDISSTLQVTYNPAGSLASSVNVQNGFTPNNLPSILTISGFVPPTVIEVVSDLYPIEINFDNDGDLDVKPEMWITKNYGDGFIEIENASFGNLPKFRIENIKLGETVYMDNENEIIYSDIPNKYRYADFNDNYLVLKRGVNRLKVKGHCTLTLRWQNRTMG